jgi:hypothetical protein
MSPSGIPLIEGPGPNFRKGSKAVIGHGRCYNNDALRGDMLRWTAPNRQALYALEIARPFFRKV